MAENEMKNNGTALDPPESTNHPSALNLVYIDMPKYYTWGQKDHKWRRRKKKGYDKTVGRLHMVPPSKDLLELFYLRMLLTQVKGPLSFEDLYNYDGDTYASYHLACIARGLAEDDSEWENTMDELAQTSSPSLIRQIFAIILTSCGPSDPKALWEKYKIYMAQDFARNRTGNIGDFTTNETDINDALLDLDLRLSPKTCICFGLPAPSARDDIVAEEVMPAILRAALNFDEEEAQEKAATALQKMNTEQHDLHNEVLQAVEECSGKFFFLDAPGGTGKTFLAKALINSVHARGEIVCPAAFSGIAALLLPYGKTAHSTFKIPCKGLNSESTCPVSKQTALAKVLKQAVLIILDEASMMHRHALEAVDRLLRDLRYQRKLFGGCVVFAMGDFRQTLPIVPRGSRAQIVKATLQKSYLWDDVIQKTLATNMRVEMARRRGVPTNALAGYADFLLNVGNGTLHIHEDLGKDIIQIPAEMLLPAKDDQTDADLRDLIDFTFSDMPTGQLQSENEDGYYERCGRYFQSKALLTPKNVDVEIINRHVLQSLPGEKISFLSADSISVGDDNEMRYPVEFLNSLEVSGLPPHQLTVKVGAVLMCLRNISMHDGLCNGTRFILTKATSRVLHGIIINGSAKGCSVVIPRIPLIPSDSRFPFSLRRVQFPVKLAFAMTINKSQGQSLERVGLFLPHAAFGHGQIYVALGRSGNPPHGHLGVRIVVMNTPKQGRFEGKQGVFTRNVVYHEILTNN
jgi:hypothetical protein